MDFDTEVKLAIYRHIAQAAQAPTVEDVATALGVAAPEIREAYARLFRNRLLVLEPDGVSIRMAPPFAGIPTQHLVRVGGQEYFANCAWDALGVVAALQQPGEVFSRCEQTLEPLHLVVHEDGPEPEPCVIHFAVPAAHWWKDIVYT